MKPRSYFAILFCIPVLSVLAACSATSMKYADTIYHNGAILTMAGSEAEYAAALAVKDGKIFAAGDKAGVLETRGAETRVVDLEGKTLLPGFLDGHSHYINSLLVANQCMLYAPPSGPGKDVPSIVAELKKFVTDRAIPEGELVIGYGYDDTVMPGGRLLNRGDLDEAFPNHAVRIDHVSMHGAVLNSLALKKYGISAETQTPPGGIIIRKPGTQEPWGLIMETAFLPVMEQSEPMTAQQEIEWTRAGQMLYAEAGITTAHEGATHLPQYQTMRRAADAGANLIDIVCYPFITDVEKVLAQTSVDQWGTYQNRLKIGGVKVTLDGSPQGRTAFFSSPYLTGGPGGEQDWTGEPTFPQDLANEMFKKVYELNVPLLAHCNGDAAIDAFLTAYEHARDGDYTRPWNVTTIHTQFIRPDQIPRFVKYKVRPSFYTLHTFYFADAHIANRGPEQAAYISPLRDAIDAGLRPSNHTDFVVAPLDQMMMLWSAVNRMSRNGEAIGPDQRVSPYEGLLCMTRWTAEQYGEQDTKGSLEVGKLADLVILDQNPLEIDPLKIRDIKVVETIKQGQTIYPMADNHEAAGFAVAGDPDRTYAWRMHICDKPGVNMAAGKTWTLTTLEGERIDMENPPTIMFDQGTLSFFGGINRLTGSYAMVGHRIVIGDIASTKMAGPEALMKLESACAKIFAQVDSFHVHGNELELFIDEQLVAELTHLP